MSAIEESAETCRPVMVTGIDGEPVAVAVLGAEAMDDTDRGYLEQIVQAAQRRYRAEHPERPTTAERLDAL